MSPERPVEQTKDVGGGFTDILIVAQGSRLVNLRFAIALPLRGDGRDGQEAAAEGACSACKQALFLEPLLQFLSVWLGNHRAAINPTRAVSFG